MGDCAAVCDTHLRQPVGLGRVVVQRRQVVVHEELVDELNLCGSLKNIITSVQLPTYKIKIN